MRGAYRPPPGGLGPEARLARDADGQSVTGVAGVMALVLAETVAGAAAFLWLTTLWTEVKRGFFKLLGAILTLLAALTWLTVDAAVAGRLADGALLRATTAVAAAATLLWTAL